VAFIRLHQSEDENGDGSVDLREKGLFLGEVARLGDDL